MNFLTAVSRQMTRFTALIIVLASIIAFIEPATFSWVKGDTQVVVLGIIMLGMGMTLGKEDYQILAQRPLDIFIGAIAQYTRMTYLVGQTVEMDGWGMFKFMLLVTLLPVVIGSVANILLHKKHWFEDVRAIMPAVAVIAFACIVGGVAAVHGHRFAESAFVMVLAIAAHNIGGYILGYYSGALTGMNTAKKRTLAIEVGVQNAGLATGLSAKFFPGNAESAVAAAVACVWHSVSGTVLGNLFAWWDKRKQ